MDIYIEKEEKVGQWHHGSKFLKITLTYFDRREK